MKTYRLVSYPHPALRKKAQPVTEITDEIQHLIQEMLRIMYEGNGESTGIGLAANQVNSLHRVIVMDTPQYRDENAPMEKRIMINPEIVWASEEMMDCHEGCLSVPHVSGGPVPRHARIRVKYMDEHGKTHEEEADQLFANCIQHEIDHLNGVMYFDYLPKGKRMSFMRKYEKAQREEKKAGN